MNVSTRYTASYKGKRIEFDAETIAKAQRHAEEVLKVPASDYLKLKLDLADPTAAYRIM